MATQTQSTYFDGIADEEVEEVKWMAKTHGKLTAGKISQRMALTAIAYLQQWDGDFEFLQSVKESFHRSGEISPGQAAGVLNCMLAELRRKKDTRQMELFQQEAKRTLDIPEGTYTLVGRQGSYFTFRIKVIRNPDNRLNGKKIIEYLSGPNNDTDFTAFGFVDESDNVHPVKLWKRFYGGALVDKIPYVENALSGDGLEEAGQAYALESGRCRRCNRTLTVPASIHRGYGPECANKVGA